VTRPRAPRRGVTLTEIQVSMVVLGIGLAGLCPLLVMQSKMLRKFESGPIGTDNPQIVRGIRLVNGVPYVPESGANTAPVAILQPQPDAWVRRLGMPASFASEADPQSFPDSPSEVTLDDDAATLTGTWTVAPTDSAYNLSLRTLPASRPGSATWSFTGLSPGRYRVMFSWNAGVPMADDATFTIGTGGPAVKVKDAVATSDGAWRDLGTYTVDTSLAVRLDGSAGGAVYADAVRIGARNAVAILPNLDTDPAAPDGGARARVSVGAKP
jgi:hypothetical protein